MGRIRLRRPRGAAELVAAGVVALAVLVLVARTVVTAVGALKAAWPALLALALLTGAVAAWRVRQATTMRRQGKERLATLRITLAEFDAMDDRRFEYALRDLLVRDGWQARRVGGGGDQAADVIGDHSQRGRIVVQAKHTRVGGKVGSSVMYAVKGTAGPVHKADHAVVVTNGAFTRDAMAWGDRHGVHWIDRERLRRWAENGAALHDLLGLSARSRPSRFRRAA
ncbi:restriction endonuclease [Streptomyces griseorubiginosus]|uniref:restriction endonuclease n=1 Tax=Streptomyces griseorubiginosus TaxID=67304 RepID=UPI002E809252|nr:restriction endonuclease [Streptomyces griseorubiginosus]WUB42681.1 restriction endonuclease [Streptomyces griseorubiginosus]WUB51200.1 restriction endonuclease [Streptomyces griseorubiginosus]